MNNLKQLFLFFQLILLVGCSSNHPADNKVKSNQTVNSGMPTGIGVAQNISNNDEFAYVWTWSDYEGRVYTDTIKVSKTEVENASNKRLKITAISPTFPMPDYSKISDTHEPFIEALSLKLKRKGQEYNLIQSDVLNMTVSMVQNIPYTLIHNGSHLDIEAAEKKNGGSFINGYHKNPNNNPYERDLFGGCQSNVEPCGVYSPAEFASHLRGDCDTRTVFLYTLLKNMNFDVAIANGPGHSMLVTSNLPKNPAAKFLIYKGQKYYFWETTVFYNQPNIGRGPQNGDTPADFDPSQWNIVLI
jgi:hypothetical protein